MGTRLARLIRARYGHDLYAFRPKRRVPNSLGIKEIHHESELAQLKPTIAFITNPTAKHMSASLKAAVMGMHLFIEKPLSHDLTHWHCLADIIRRNRLTAFVACNLRFNPMLRYLKGILDPSRIQCVQAISSSYLPDWRPGQDYRESYSAKRNLGGGVILDLIHEPDYCRWLFGDVVEIKGTAGKASNLEIDTEDYADMILTHATGIQSHIHVDYSGTDAKRQLDVYGKDVYVHADILEGTLEISGPWGTRARTFHTEDKDSSYAAELGYFFGCLDKGLKPMNHAGEHVELLKPLLFFKKQTGW